MPRLNKWDNFDVDALDGGLNEGLTLAHSNPRRTRDEMFGEWGFIPPLPEDGISVWLKRASAAMDVAARYPVTWHNWSRRDLDRLSNIAKKLNTIRHGAYRQIPGA